MTTAISEILSPNTTSTTVNGVGDSSLGQEDFLELMVAQLSNQDPTNPADSTELFSQISQFSMVEGIDQLSNDFQSFANTYAQNQEMSYINLIGRNVMTQNNAAYFDGESPVSAVLELPASASSAVVYIQDEYGTVVGELELGSLSSGQNTFSWPEAGSEDPWLEEGNFYFYADAQINGQTQAVPVYGQNRVESVVWDSSQASFELGLEGGQKIKSNTVTGIFQ